MKSDTVIDIQDLKVSYKTRVGIVQAVDGVSFSIKKEKSVGLVGESGCGKTTLALSILKLLPPQGYIESGRILFDGEDLVQNSEKGMRKIRGNKASIAFQGAMNALNPVKPIGEQISEGLLLHKNMSKTEAISRAKELLSWVGISPSESIAYPHKLSGGMKQRVVIAIALVCGPQLLIADEPVTALDVMVQAQILELFNELKQKMRLSVLLITHDLSVVMEACDNIAVMYGGKIVEYMDTMDSLLHPYTQKLFKAFPNIKGPRTLAGAIPGAPPKLINPPKGCRFKPRCDQSRKICGEEDPQPVEIDNGHFVACHSLRSRAV